MIADNLQKIKQEIQDSCALVHRDPKEVTLVAVTKSVESAQAEELVRAGVMNCAELSCFIEVNVSGEESKHGISPDELLPFVESLAACTKIKVVGLMTMAPKEASDEQIHKVFGTLKELRDLVQAKGYAHAPCSELSMGMSQDFQIAIEEGATFIRVGTALFKDE